jgi:hypothetical protein
MGDVIWILIPLAPFLLGGFAIWSKHQREMAGRHSGPDNREVQQLASQVEMLQDRVHVLERIVTDQGYSVASQIEALRDPRGVEDRAAKRQLEGNS